MDHLEAPSTLESLSIHEFTPKTRQAVATLLDQQWNSFDVGAIFGVGEKYLFIIITNLFIYLFISIMRKLMEFHKTEMRTIILYPLWRK